jgi:Zn-dependent protease
MVLFFAVANYAFGFGSLIPAASLDGEVILRELRRSRRQL